MQDKHGDDLHYKMVVVVAPCETGILAILSTSIYKMVLVVAPCKTDMVILTTRWWWLPVYGSSSQRQVKIS